MGRDCSPRTAQEYPELADQLDKMQRRQLPDGWDADLPDLPADPRVSAGRDASGKVLNAIAQRVPWLIGGSSDLAPSNKSRLTFDGAGDFSAENRAGRNLHFGVREHAAGAVANGLALSQDPRLPGRVPDLLRLPARRPAAVGADGAAGHPPLHPRLHRRRRGRPHPPAHRAPRLAAGHARPDRPAARRRQRGRRGLAGDHAAAARPGRADPVPAGAADPGPDQVRPGQRVWPSGAYVLAGDPDATPDVILIASGSEVGLAVEAYEHLTADGIARPGRVHAVDGAVRPADPEYRDTVLPPAVTARVVIEQASAFGWDRWAGIAPATIIAMSTFGASAPLKALQVEVRLHPRSSPRSRPQTTHPLARRIRRAPSYRFPASPQRDSPMSTATPVVADPDRNLALELVRATEAAAISCSRYLGFGDKNAVDAAAVDAMRPVLGTVRMNGVVVIGEGEKDEAPMLFNGERVGDGTGSEWDIAVDPVDGTTLTAKSLPDAVSVIGVSARGTMFDPGPALAGRPVAVIRGLPGLVGNQPRDREGAGGDRARHER